VMPSLRHASTTASPFPSSSSMIRNCPMISSRHLPFPCHAPSFRQPEILTPDLTWFKGRRSREAGMGRY
jgi:hypothetical protein